MLNIDVMVLVGYGMEPTIQKHSGTFRNIQELFEHRCGGIGWISDGTDHSGTFCGTRAVGAYLKYKKSAMKDHTK